MTTPRPSHMVTTADNPFNPFTQFDEWNTWDTSHGYHTLAFLARIVKTSSDLSEADQDFAIECAIDEIIEYNVSGVYKKVAEPTSDDTSTAA
jgi:hypothetical protein